MTHTMKTCSRCQSKPKLFVWFQASDEYPEECDTYLNRMGSIHLDPQRLNLHQFEKGIASGSKEKSDFYYVQCECHQKDYSTPKEAIESWNASLEKTDSNVLDVSDLFQNRAAVERVFEFFKKHAIGTLAAPNCFICGKSTQIVEVGIQHLELPGVVICESCIVRNRNEDVSATAEKCAGFAELYKKEHAIGLSAEDACDEIAEACRNYGKVYSKEKQ